MEFEPSGTSHGGSNPSNPGNPGNSNNPWGWRRWLARLSLSFIVLGLLLAWQGRRASQDPVGPIDQKRVVLFYVGAGLSLGVGFAGVRERHRR